MTRNLLFALALACSAWLGQSIAETQTGVITGSSLVIRTAAGHTLTVDDRGFIFTTPNGRWRFDGNEEKVESLGDDPPKVRLASRGSLAGALSYNWLRPDDNHEEVAMEYTAILPGFGADRVSFLRLPHVPGDGAMVGYHSASSASGQVVVAGSTPPPPPPPAPPPPPPPVGSTVPVALVSTTNLIGVVEDVQAVDGRFLRAASTGQDTDVVADLHLTTSGRLRVEVRSVDAGNTAPYVYIWIDGERIPTGQLSGLRVYEAPIAAGTRRVRVHGSAQDGTIEVGAIVVQP